jgi:hypothetical protein
MMQNFYNKASAHNSLSNNYPKNPPKPKNPKTKSNSKTTKTPTKAKKKEKIFETNYKINILSKQFPFPFCEKERNKEREREREREREGECNKLCTKWGFFVFFLCFLGCLRSLHVSIIE